MVTSLALAQGVTGAILSCCGVAPIGVALIGESIGDLIYAGRSFINRDFNWVEYGILKSLSLGWSACSSSV